MVVVMKIVEGEPPLLEGSCWSEEFKNFVKLCLVKKPRERASGKTLLEHPFLAKARDTNFLKQNFLKDLKPVDQRDIHSLQARGEEFKKLLGELRQPKRSKLNWDFGTSTEDQNKG